MKAVIPIKHKKVWCILHLLRGYNNAGIASVGCEANNAHFSPVCKAEEEKDFQAFYTELFVSRAVSC
jgi:hypothetical protein